MGVFLGGTSTIVDSFYLSFHQRYLTQIFWRKSKFFFGGIFCSVKKYNSKKTEAV